MFHIDVAQVDQDVTYVAIVIHARCKRVFKNVSSVFQKHVASVFILGVAISMLHMFLQ